MITTRDAASGVHKVGWLPGRMRKRRKKEEEEGGGRGEGGERRGYGTTLVLVVWKFK